jgi:hypothetical protein
MQLAMLDTVPAEVSELACSQGQLDKLTSGHPEMGVRLVSACYPDMRDVCEHKDPEFPTFFFHFVLELPARWERLPKAGTKQYQADVEAIAAASESLAELLERHQQEIDFARGSPLTFHHVEVRSRTIRQELAGEVAAPDGWSYAGLDNATGPPPALPDFLRALAQELRPLRVPRDTIIRPTRVAGETAERTFMVRSLIGVFSYIKHSEPSFGVVATTINTLTDEEFNPVDANHAAKLSATCSR